MQQLNEKDAYALKYADYLSHKLFLSLPHQIITYYAKEDIKSEVLLNYLEKVKGKIDNREVGWKTYIQRSCNNFVCDFIKERKKQNENTISSDYLQEKTGDIWQIENGLGCNFTELFSLTIGDEDMIVNVDTVENLCHLFKVKFNLTKPEESLKQVLELTLNQYDNETFRKLPIQIQKELLDLGQAVDNRKLEIAEIKDREERKRKSFKAQGGIKGQIRRLLSKNPKIKTKEIFEYLDRKQIAYKQSVVYTNISQVKKEREEFGLDKKKKK